MRTVMMLLGHSHPGSASNSTGEQLLAQGHLQIQLQHIDPFEEFIAKVWVDRPWKAGGLLHCTALPYVC